MCTKPNEKLVRDLIPDALVAKGKTPYFRIALIRERRDFLRTKLHEELSELAETRRGTQYNGSPEYIDELVDVITVLQALRTEIHGETPQLASTHKATEETTLFAELQRLVDLIIECTTTHELSDHTNQALVIAHQLIHVSPVDTSNIWTMHFEKQKTRGGFNRFIILQMNV